MFCHCAGTFVALLASPALADAGLEQRIVEGLNAIWPDEIYTIQLDGCRVVFIHDSQLFVTGPRTEIWHLDDLVTDPAFVNRNSQRMTDGVSRWDHFNVWFDIKAEVLAQHQAQINRLNADLDHIGRDIPLTPTQRLSYDRWLADEIARMSDESRVIDAAIARGDYGPFLQRNRIFAVGISAEGHPFFEIASPTETPFGFSFRGEVVTGILDDLRAYKLAACGN